MTFKTVACITLACDECGVPLEYDDHIPHFETEQQALEGAEAYDWFVEGGKHRCDTHAPVCSCDDCDHIPTCGDEACPGCDRHAHNAPTDADLARSGQLGLTEGDHAVTDQPTTTAHDLDYWKKEAEFYVDRYQAVQRVLDQAHGVTDRDGRGQGIAADVELLRQQRDKAIADLKLVEEKRLVDAPPVDTTALDAAITDHLTRAQRHWLACGEHGVGNREEMRYHAIGHALEVTTVYLIAALKRLAPAYVDSLYLELRKLLEMAPASARWTWAELASRDVDPAAIPAFKARKPREEDARPLRYATTTPDGQAVTDESVETLKARIAELREQLAKQVHPEDLCHRCGGPNITWSAPSPLWNEVMRGGDINGPWQFGEIICPICFAEIAEAAGIATLWRFDAKRVNVPLTTVTPSGRTWNADRWLWEEPGAEWPTKAGMLRTYAEAYHRGHSGSFPFTACPQERCADAARALGEPAQLPPFHPAKLREHPGTGQPMTGVVHPADGTWSPALSSEQETCGDCASGQCHGAEGDDDELDDTCGCALHEVSTRDQETGDLLPDVAAYRARCCGDHEPTCSITAPGAECCTDCPDKNEATA